MTTDTERNDCGIFKIQFAFNKYFCISRLLMWGFATVFFYLHVIIMWGRWLPHNSAWVMTAVWSGIAAIFFNGISCFQYNFKDPYIFNKAALIIFYMALMFYSLVHFSNTGEYSAGAWLIPAISVVMTGISGCSFVQECHRVSVAYKKHCFCNTLKNQLATTGTINEHQCGYMKCLSPKRDDALTCIGFIIAICGIAIFIMWGYARIFTYSILYGNSSYGFVVFFVVFVIELIVSIKIHSEVKPDHDIEKVFVKEFIWVIAWNVVALGIGLILRNILVVLCLTLVLLMVGFIVRLNADSRITPQLIGTPYGACIIAFTPIYHILYHLNISQDSTGLYLTTCIALMFMLIAGCRYLYECFKKASDKTQ